MANSLSVFIERGQVPARQPLQDAIKRLRCKLTLDEAYVPFECAGFIPCTLDGEDAGFDIRFGEASAQLADTPAVQAQIGDRDTAIVLRWGGDPRERVSALITAAALADGFGAIVYRPSDDTLGDAGRWVDEARAAFAALQDL